MNLEQCEDALDELAKLQEDVIDALERERQLADAALIHAEFALDELDTTNVRSNAVDIARTSLRDAVRCLEARSGKERQ